LVERADEISKPGKITDQIIQAIRNADVVVADITGNNPNVMWELGFAHALEKMPVILNQAIAEAPFDLHDWRQVVYSRTPVDSDELKIATHIREALVPAAGQLPAFLNGS
ncbi:MAG TPA: nucleoside 2-deoxyribosyltransferase, partial [Acidothermaceae bacterium]